MLAQGMKMGLAKTQSKYLKAKHRLSTAQQVLRAAKEEALAQGREDADALDSYNNSCLDAFYNDDNDSQLPDEFSLLFNISVVLLHICNETYNIIHAHCRRSRR